jgi:hypothetical protein
MARLASTLAVLRADLAAAFPMGRLSLCEILYRIAVRVISSEKEVFADEDAACSSIPLNDLPFMA